MAFSIVCRVRVAVVLTISLMAPFDAVFAQPNPDLVSKGKYLTTAGGCISCHTNPGGEAFAGNRAIPTPFGTIRQRTWSMD